MAFFIKRDDQINGPFTEAQIKSGAASGKLEETDLISLSENGPWKSMGKRSKQEGDTSTPQSEKSISEIDEQASTTSTAPFKPRPLKDCPYCAEPIAAAAIKCKHCGEMLEMGKSAESSSPGVAPVRDAVSQPPTLIPELSDASEPSLLEKSLESPLVKQYKRYKTWQEAPFGKRYQNWEQAKMWRGWVMRSLLFLLFCPLILFLLGEDLKPHPLLYIMGGIVFLVIPAQLVYQDAKRKRDRTPGFHQLPHLGEPAGRPREEIVAIIGPPNSFSAAPGGVGYVCQWISVRGHFVLLFDNNDVCKGIAHHFKII